MEALNNGVELTWLGHATWLLATPGGKRVLIDPWIEDNPSFPADFDRAVLDDLDLILVTHGHFDHIGDLVPIARRSAATVVAIFDLTAWLETQGVENVAGMNKGGTQDVDGIKVTLTNAVHSSAMIDDDGHAIDLGDPCGFVIRLENGFTIYHAGDTDVFGDMALIAELYRPDLAILPVGDHFTMGPSGAAKAIELLGVRRVVPTHFGTFPALTGTPEELSTMVDETVEVLTVAPGETLR